MRTHLARILIAADIASNLFPSLVYAAKLLQEQAPLLHNALWIQLLNRYQRTESLCSGQRGFQTHKWCVIAASVVEAAGFSDSSACSDSVSLLIFLLLFSLSPSSWVLLRDHFYDVKPQLGLSDQNV